MHADLEVDPEALEAGCLIRVRKVFPEIAVPTPVRTSRSSRSIALVLMCSATALRQSVRTANARASLSSG